MTNGNKLNIIKQLIESAEQSLIRAKALLNDDSDEVMDVSKDMIEKAREVGKISVEDNIKIIEGIFDGQNMIGPDGKQYSVPANYASKSKLVEGDRLKLTIMPDGSFVYKQIGPIDRNRLIGSLIRDETTNEFMVVTSNKTYKVLLASITYFKGDAGDEVVILVPKDHQTQWAAVENIIKKTSGTEITSDRPDTESADEPDDLD
ncbi:MAG: hypothetical protein V1853_02510 [bacterium]